MTDTETGLPTLPKGEFWRLKKKVNGWSGEKYAVLQIIQPYTIEKRKRLDLLLFSIPYGAPYHEEHENTLYSIVLWDPTAEVPQSEESPRFTVDIDGTKFKILDVDKVTEDHIRAAADTCLALRAKAEKADSLYGDYPPKSLNREESR